MIRPLRDWHYAAEQRLGDGGYAQTYRCRNRAFGDAEYAVKVFDNPYYVNTFEKEIGALQALEGCPGTPPLVDYGRNEEGKLCIVCGFVPGVRLDRHIASCGALSLEQTLALLAQMLEVMSFAHARGLLHKDIKASNILMEGGRFTLLDWGVAELRGNGRSEIIRAGQDFVAPECYCGAHDFATDFYSLGWLAVYALTGSLPYHFDQISDRDYRVVAHCLEAPLLPDDVPAPLCSLILNWLAKQPTARLVGYDLGGLQARAVGREPDFSPYLDLRRIQWECAYLHLAARHGIPYAQHQLALRLLKQERGDEAIYWLERAVEAGYVPSIYRLSRTLSKDARQDPARAAELLREAAGAGMAKARYALGMSLLRAGEAARDVHQAADWLRLSADGGFQYAQYELGRLLEKEFGRPDEAAAYLRMAAERGYPKDALNRRNYSGQ